MNTPKPSKNYVLHAAVFSILAAGSLSLGQTRVDRSGALDANNRVGSGGVNQVNTSPQPWQISNDIVYGNATGGKAFRGGLSSFEQNEFRGVQPGRGVDNFIRDSSGVTTNGVASYNANTTTPFYGSSRFAPPPPGFTQVGPAGTYTAPTASAWTTVDPRAQSLGTPVIAFSPQNGPGPLNDAIPGNQASPTLNAPQSPGLSGGNLSDYTAVGQDVGTSPQLSAAQAKQPREAAGDGTVKSARVGNPIDTSLTGGDMNAVPMSDGVASASVSNAVAPLPGDEPGMITRVTGAANDSGTYADLAKRRGEQEQAMRPGQAAEEAATQYNQQMKAKKDAEAKAKAADQTGAGKGAAPGTAAPGTDGAPGNTPANTPAKTGDGPAGMAMPGMPAPTMPTPAMPPAGVPKGAKAMPEPLKINSLATPGSPSSAASGVDAMLTKAEGQMREGKFASAIDTYDAAETQAPNNGLIKLGRTNAELGGSYYRRAETSLRQTLSADKNLLAGQYDLRAFMGDDRLAIVQKDLSDLVQKNPGDADAAVLLAYVYYNTGNERRAAALLDLADKRAAGKDEFVTLLKASWNLSGKDNK